MGPDIGMKFHQEVMEIVGYYIKIGTQTWNSKFGLPNLKIGQIPSLGTTITLIIFFIRY